MPTNADKQKAAEARRNAEQEAIAAKAAAKRKAAEEKQKAAEERRLAEEARRKAVKPRTTLNSGGIGRVSQFLSTSRDRLSRKLSGSKKNIAERAERDHSNLSGRSLPALPRPSSRDHTRDQSHETAYPRQQYQEQQGDAAEKMSTPFASPTTGRHTPANLINSENQSALSSILDPADLDDEAVDQLVLTNPTAENVPIMEQRLKARVEDFGRNFRNQEDWKDTFEGDGEDLLLKIEALRRVCSSLSLTDHVVSLLQLQSDCEGHINQLKTLAVEERRTDLQRMISHPRLTPGREIDPFRQGRGLMRSPVVAQPGSSRNASPRADRSPASPRPEQLPTITVQKPDGSRGAPGDNDIEPQYSEPHNSPYVSGSQGAPSNLQHHASRSQADTIAAAVAANKERYVSMQNALSEKANASELAETKADIVRVQQLLSELNVSAVRSDVGKIQKIANDVLAKQDAQSKVIDQILVHLDRNARSSRSLEKEVKSLQSGQAEMDADIKLLKDVTNAEFVPRGFTPKRVCFPDAGTGQGYYTGYPAGQGANSQTGLSPDRFTVSDEFRQSRRMHLPPSGTGITGITARQETPATTAVPSQVTTTWTTSGVTTSAQSMSSARQNVMAPQQTYPARSPLAQNYGTHAFLSPPTGLYTPAQGSSHNRGTPGGNNYVDNDRAQVLINEANKLIARLHPPLNDRQLDKQTILSFHKSKLPGIENDRRDLGQALDLYLDNRTTDIDMEMLKTVRTAASQAKDWINGIRDMYDTLECHKKDFDDKLFSSLKRFSDKSDMSVFEFISKFESYTKSKGDEYKRADLLYNEYLDKEIQERVVQFKADYHAMKKCLFSTYGNVRNITNKLFKKIKEDVPAEGAPESDLYRHYKALNYAIQRTAEMTNVEGVPRAELENHIYSVDFIGMLKELLVPYTVKYDYMEELEAAGYCNKSPSGETPFRMYVARVSKRFKRIEDSVSESTKQSWKKAQADKPRQKPAKSPPKKTFATVVGSKEDDCSEDDGQAIVHFTDSKQKQQAQAKQSSPRQQRQKKQPQQHTKTAPAPTPTASPKFPCGIHKGEHELGQCTEFFKIRPTARKSRWINRFACPYCLGKGCDSKGCKNTIPKALTCEGCVEFAKAHNFPRPNNVLFCPIKTHQKATKDEVNDALRTHLKGYNAKQMGQILVLHAWVTAFSCECDQPCECKPGRSKSSAPVENAPTPAFDTQSGKLCNTSGSTIVQESPEDTVYVTQIINIGGRDVLVFYDRGASHNIIDGNLAEELQFKVVSDKPSTMGTLSQDKVMTGYETYAFYLGAEDDSFFHMTAQGFDLQNQKFPFCDLKSINAEVAQAKQLPRGAVLPKFMGGQQIGILIGLKNPALEPQLVFQLPCGMGIYKSAIKDKFGSNYCYGGPHESFTKISRNKKLRANFSAITAYFTQMSSTYNKSLYPAVSQALSEELEEISDGLCVISNKGTQALITTHAGNTIETTPLSEENMSEMGCVLSNAIRITEDTETGCIHPGSKSVCSCKDHVSAFKAAVPIAKRKEYIDAPDEALLEDNRCLECRRCKVCAKSPRDQVMSLNEQAEQFAIESSVCLDTEKRRVIVQLPFVKDPVDFLSKRHKGPSNFGQAIKIYESQCRKNETIKNGIRATHKDLLEKGFMKKLSALSREEQELVSSARFRHFMPWHSVYKESLSTPVRMVVDASCTGINEVLAKGTNSVQSIFDILVRSRCGKYLWTSDISKLYNQLHLSPSAYPYSLFLFHESLSTDTRPDTYVLVRAWYGVTSTGNQSAVALGQIADSVADQYPRASKVVKSNLYVDDSVNANNSCEEMEEEIAHSRAALLTGGFTMKYVAKSGQPPPPEASADEKHLKILGYVWTPEDDKLSLGFQEINFNKKRRGQKKSNPFPVRNSDDLTKLLKGYKITRRMVVSKIAELFDPLGLFEPYKVQLKLDNSLLNGLEWDAPICQEYQQIWTERFHEMLEFPKVITNRCVVPEDVVDPDNIRLLAVADAAEHAGGAAVYASWLLQDGTYSCQLLTSRSKLLNQTIPRNELESIKIMSDLVLDVQRALGDRVKETLYFSDSTVAICWVHTVSKRLRMYTLHRVVDIRANMCGRENILSGSPQLYHIDGKINIADLLTKKHSITPKDLTGGSAWQTGYPWMKKPLDQMPITRYEQLTVKSTEQEQVDIECFPTPFLTGHVYVEPIADNLDDVLDQNIFADLYAGDWEHSKEDKTVGPDASKADELTPQSTPEVLHTKIQHPELDDSSDIRHHGYEAYLYKLSIVIQSISIKTHMYHVSKGVNEKPNCLYCRATKISSSRPFQFKIAYRQFAFEYLLRKESTRLKQQLSSNKLKQYSEVNGILYYHSRLSEEISITSADLDTDVFFDGHQIKSLLPVVSANSDLFLVYAIHVHEKIKPHSGIESTLGEISKVMFVIDNPRRVIKLIRNKCPRCRLIQRKTLELRIMNHPHVRTELAPPFYNVMIDTVFGFKCQSFKGARGKTTKMYALIIVCLLTGAVNILAINGLETQDVLQGLERHSAKYGIPKSAYVDNGTQLICLNRANFDIRDMQAQVQKSLGLEVVVSTPKSHEERGRVEAKVKALRNMMDKLVVATSTAMTALEWETLFQKISSMLNDIPIAKSSTSNLTDLGWDIITPNRLILGRNHYRSLEGSIRIEQADSVSKLLHKNSKILRAWYSIFASRIHHLIPRPTKWKKDDPIHVGDIVLFLHNDSPMDNDVWSLGRVEKIIKPTQVELKYFMHSDKKGKPVMKHLLRSPRDISIIQHVDEKSMYVEHSEDN